MAETEDWAGADNNGLAALQQAESLDALGPVLSGLCRQFGFLYYKVYRSPLPFSNSLRDLLLMTDLPDWFVEAFDEIGYTPDAMARMRTINRSQLTQWTIDDILQREEPAKNARLLQLLSEIGIGCGVYVNIEPLDGPARILSFVGRDNSLSVRQAEQMTVVAVELLHKINRLEKRREWDRAGLTSLELDCLVLASQGHEAQEIGRQLGLSGRTVLYLTNSLCSKLKATSLEQAVAAALRSGFIA